MQAMIISDTEKPASTLRAILRQQDCDCPATSVVSLANSRSALARANPAPAMVFVFCLRDLETAVTALRQSRKVTDATLVAIGVGSDSEQILTIIRSGADDYLDLSGPFEEALIALLVRVRARLAEKRGRGRIVAITSASGGCGCSTLAVNLATDFARGHGRCGLIDLKLRGGDLATLLGVKARQNISDLCKQPNLDAEMFEQSLTKHPSGVCLIPSPPFLEHVGIVEAAAIARVIDLAAATFAFLVVDLEDMFHREQLQVIATCDALLMIVRLDFASLLRTRKSLVYLERQGIDTTKIQIVVNRAGGPNEVSLPKASEALAKPIQHVLPDNAKCVTEANNLGEPVMLHAPHANVSKAIRGLAASLVDQ